MKLERKTKTCATCEMINRKQKGGRHKELCMYERTFVRASTSFLARNEKKNYKHLSHMHGEPSSYRKIGIWRTRIRIRLSWPVHRECVLTQPLSKVREKRNSAETKHSLTHTYSHQRRINIYILCKRSHQLRMLNSRASDRTNETNEHSSARLILFDVLF